MELRAADRRVKRTSIRWPERRTGFDRRCAHGISVLRDSSVLLLVMLGVLNILNMLDLRLTLLGLERGAVEANPVMTFLFSMDSLSAGLFKIAVVLAVSLTVWWGRKYRRILEFAVLSTALYALVITYHVVGLTFILPNA